MATRKPAERTLASMLRAAEVLDASKVPLCRPFNLRESLELAVRRAAEVALRWEGDLSATSTKGPAEAILRDAGLEER